MMLLESGLDYEKHGGSGRKQVTPVLILTAPDLQLESDKRAAIQHVGQFTREKVARYVELQELMRLKNHQLKGSLLKINKKSHFLI